MTRGLEVNYTNKEQRSLIHLVGEWGHGPSSLVTGGRQWIADWSLGLYD